MRKPRGIRAVAWSLLVAGMAAPALRRRLSLPPAVVLTSAGLSPLLLAVLRKRSPVRDVAVVALNMFAYKTAYEMPNDDPVQAAERARVEYPIAIDRALGLGVAPSVRLQRAFAREGEIRPFERFLVWCHWLWFAVPHGAVAYVWLRKGNDRLPGAAARMYAVFDLGAIFYWTIPTAPPWWAAARGELEDGRALVVRRMMIEYGEQFWGKRWPPLFNVLGGNPLAAMPSLHFATSLMAADLLSDVGPVSAVVGWGYATALGLSLVYLGEHYVIDLIGGAALFESVRRGAPRVTPVARHISRTIQRLQERAGTA